MNEINQGGVQREEPPVLGYYRAYCALLLVVWLIVTPVLIWILISQGSEFPLTGTGMAHVDRMMEELEAQRRAEMMGRAMLPIGLCLVLSIPVAIAFTLKPSPGSWIYHIVIICLGLSGCTLPISVLLLIYWFQPRTQAYFGRSTPE